jgi:hypothetical protein
MITLTIKHLRHNNAGGIAKKIFNLNDDEQVWENVTKIDKAKKYKVVICLEENQKWLNSCTRFKKLSNNVEIMIQKKKKKLQSSCVKSCKT